MERSERASLWRRDRADPFPVTQFYLVAPPSQAELVYDEAKARERYARLQNAPAGQGLPSEAP